MAGLEKVGVCVFSWVSATRGCLQPAPGNTGVCNPLLRRQGDDVIDARYESRVYIPGSPPKIRRQKSAGASSGRRATHRPVFRESGANPLNGSAGRSVKVGSSPGRSLIIVEARVLCRARGDGVRPPYEPPQTRSGLITPTGRQFLPSGRSFLFFESDDPWTTVTKQCRDTRQRDPSRATESFIKMRLLPVTCAARKIVLF